MQRRTAVMLLCLLAVAASAQPNKKKSGNKKGKPTCTPSGSFTPQCNPFGNASRNPHIDSMCGLTGTAKDDGGKAQDRQKNNLCATGTPTELTIQQLKTLQADVDQTDLDYGSTHTKPPHAGPPANREEFFQKEHDRGFGEGDPVTFVGYIVEAKKGGSETVNCNCTDPASIDVHMALATKRIVLKRNAKDDPPEVKKKNTASNNAALCRNSFATETIPHLRPAALELGAISPLVNKKIVKITGQLFFDASHRPCKGSVAGSGDPARLTVWEIHPVYSIEVCTKTSLAQCTVASSNWQPLQASRGRATHSGSSKKKKKKKG
jgi:hypothetical protein